MKMQQWWPFIYDQCHVGCAKCKRGKLWYQWDESHEVNKTRNITCDNCTPGYREQQLQLL